MFIRKQTITVTTEINQKSDVINNDFLCFAANNNLIKLI